MQPVELENWIRNHLADILGISVDAIHPNYRFDKLGLDSAAAIGLVGDLEDILNIELDPTLPYDNPTPRLLARAIEKMQAVA